MNFFENPWVIGIITGILSGFVVFFISNLINSRAKSEYNKKLVLANKEIIQILKPFIADCGLPEKKIFLSLISSIAREYQVKKADMYGISSFCEELIKEVFRNPYFTDDKKKEYATLVENYADSIIYRHDIENRQTRRYMPIQSYDRDKKILMAINTVISVAAAILGFVFSFIQASKPNPNGKLSSSQILLISLFIITILIIIMLLIRYFYNRRKVKQKSISKDDEKNE